MLLEKERVKEAQNIVLIVTGGVGRNIMATAVIKNLKEALPEKDIIVVAGCPDIFLKNPKIKRIIGLGQPHYFYEDYIKNQKSIVINVEPYQHYDYIYRKKHFIECWCDMLGIECKDMNPEIFLSEAEKKMARIYLEKFDKGMVLFQHCGGKNPEDKSEKADLTSKAGMYKRDLRKGTVQKVADGLINRGFMVGAVQTENQFCPSMAEKINFPIRAILALIPHVKAIIGIDSFLQHGTAIFKKKSIILWGGTNPKVLGYSQNVNLTREVCDNPMCHRPNSYLFDFEPTGFMWDCPKNDVCMDYSAKEILTQFDKLTGGKNDGAKRKGKGKPEASDKRKVAKETKRITGSCKCSGKELSTDPGPACPNC